MTEICIDRERTEVAVWNSVDDGDYCLITYDHNEYVVRFFKYEGGYGPAFPDGSITLFALEAKDSWHFSDLEALQHSSDVRLVHVFDFVTVECE